MMTRYPHTGHGRGTRSTSPSWVASIVSVQSGGTWTQLTSSPTLATAITPLLPAGTFLGTNPIGAIRDAYASPFFDPTTNTFALFGGGHSDGSINGVFVFDPQTLTYNVGIPTTPPASYPPLYTAPNASITYPSGFTDGTFQTAAVLTDARDTPYAAATRGIHPQHNYASIYSNGNYTVIYDNSAVGNVASGLWTQFASLTSLPSQIKAIGVRDNTNAQNTNATLPVAQSVCVLEPASRKAWFTYMPGDSGDGWRNMFVRIDPQTLSVEAVIDNATGAGTIDYDTSICIGESKLWTFSTHQATPHTYDIYRALPTNASSPSDYIYGSLVGTLPAAVASSFENACTAWVNGRIYFWNYASATDKDALFWFSTTPDSGLGTLASPFIHTVTRLALPASGMPVTNWQYSFDYIAGWGVIMVLPSSTAKWWALKL